VIRLEKLKLYNNQDRNRDSIDEKIKRLRFQLLGLLSQVYNIVIYIYKSFNRIKKFINLIKRIILIDNRIR